MSKVLIAGCGFVGVATARLFHEHGWEVLGLTHSPESAQALSAEPYRVTPVDLADAAAVRQLGSGWNAVVHCASSGRGGADAYRQVYLQGARHLLALRPERLLFTSSTSVYAQVDGSIVTEESLAEPDRETGRLLRETEAEVLAAGGIAARLAGIYGPARSVLLRKFFNGDARIEGDGSRWINQVHRDDIASAIFHLISSGSSGIFNVNDNEPLQQRAIYEWLAQRFGRPVPPSGPIDPNRKRGVTNKRVSNARLRATGWEPRFPNFFTAVEQDAGLLDGIAG